MFYIKTFLEYLKLERNYSERTVDSYRLDLELFVSFLRQTESTLTWNTVDKDLVRRWVIDMMDKGNTPRSVNRRLSALRSFYRFLLIRGVVQNNPAKSVVGPKKGKDLPYFLKESEMDRLLDEVKFEDSFWGMRDRLMICLFYSTGVRLSELIGLNVEDVDLSQCQLKVTGKRNKQRIIPFGAELAEMLQAYLAVRQTAFKGQVGEALILSTRGARMTPDGVRRLVKIYLSQVTTLKKKTPHVLRHTFATALLNHDADLEVVKELLGHDSLAATQIYTHTTFEEMKKVYKQAHPRA